LPTWIRGGRSATHPAEARNIWSPQRRISHTAKRIPPESGGQLPENGRAKSPKETGQSSYAIASREGHRVVFVYIDHPKSKVSREHFADIQPAIGRLVDEHPEERITPRMADSYCPKEAAIKVCQVEMTKTLAGR